MVRRFPPPWTAEQQDSCFIVRDRNGRCLLCRSMLSGLRLYKGFECVAVQANTLDAFSL